MKSKKTLEAFERNAIERATKHVERLDDAWIVRGVAYKLRSDWENGYMVSSVTVFIEKPNCADLYPKHYMYKEAEKDRRHWELI